MKRHETNTTTHFFREPLALEVIRDLLVAPRTAEARATHAWCVGCSSGDEPYSLAITCREAGGAIEILATDVNPQALATAQAGVYPARHLRHVSEARRTRWFQPRGEKYQVVGEVREAVRFASHDITHDDVPGQGFDVVLCRNVMVYFTRHEATRAVRTMLSALRPGGLLVIGASEWLPADVRSGAGVPAELVDLGGVMVYRTPELTGGRGPAGVPAGTGRVPVAPAAAPAAVVIGRAVVAEAPPPPATAAAPPATAAAPPATAAAPPAPARPPAADDVARLRAEGDQLLDRGELDAARARYEQARDRAPLLPDLHLRLALVELQAGREASAREALRRSLFLEPALWPAWLLLADLSANEPQVAAVCFARARAALEGQADALAQEPALEPFLRDRRTALDVVRRRLAALEPR